MLILWSALFAPRRVITPRGETMPEILTIDPTSVLAAGGTGLESWQIGLVAFGFVGVVLLVGSLVERWVVNLHA